MPTRVLHLVGSPTSAEFDELSCLYARGCLAALSDRDELTHLICHVGPDGGWRFPAELSADGLAAATRFLPAEAIFALSGRAIDVMVPHMFCPAGMTHYRALFDVLGIPYVGNPPEVMAIGARKDLTRAIAAGAGVAVPEGELLSPGQVPSLDPPVVVKPADGDNSAGVGLVRAPGDYAAALSTAFEHSGAVLVERFIAPGRELRCGVLERDGELVALIPEEYPLGAERPIRTAADKLGRDRDGGLALMAKTQAEAWIVAPDDPVLGVVQAAARRAHEALGCRHYSLFDFRIDPDGQPWLLEASLYCSFSPQSVIATMARAEGIDAPELFDIALAAALGPERGAVR